MVRIFKTFFAPRMRKVVWRLSVWSLSMVAVLALFHQSKLRAQPEITATRDIQLLLSLGGYYSGPLGGVCDTQTLEAISKYKQTNPNLNLLIECNNHLLKVLKDDFRSAAASFSNGSDLNKAKEIGELRNEVKNANAAIKGLSDSFSSQFVTQYNSLASIGVTTILTAIAIFIASGTLLIKTAVEESHKQLLKESSEKLTSEIDAAKGELLKVATTAHHQISARIASNFSGHCINLYKDNPKPQETDGKQPPSYKLSNIYESYLQIALGLGQDGYDSACAMENSLKERLAEPTPEQQQVAAHCLNNYIFYLAQREEKADEANVRRLLTRLEELAVQNRSDHKYWMDYQDTVIWVKLHLGDLSAEQARSAVESLISETSAPSAWRAAAKERYDFYDRFPSHTEKVNLSV